MFFSTDSLETFLYNSQPIPDNIMYIFRIIVKFWKPVFRYGLWPFL